MMKHLSSDLQAQDSNYLFKSTSATDQQVCTLQTKLVSDLLQHVKELESVRKDLEASQVERVQIQVCCHELMSKLTELEHDGNNKLDSHRDDDDDGNR